MKYLLCSILALMVANCASINARAPEREFNFEEFTGLVSKQAATYEDVVLDYDLDDEKGEKVHFASCLQVDSTDETSILASEYQLFNLLSIHCRAIGLYLEKGVQAKQSYFPAKLTKELLYSFPAAAGPRISKYSLEKRAGKTLKEYEPLLDISIIDDNTSEVLTQNHETTFDIMARADFNADGFEDLLVRILWHVRDAFGKGSDLFILEKTSSTGPVVLTWRY